MRLRVAFICLCIFFLPDPNWAQVDLLTEGEENYWEESKEEVFKIFKPSFYAKKRVIHQMAIRDHSLFIRLDDDHKRISILEEKGLSKSINKLKKKNLKRNKALVEAFNKYYENDNFYFYYAKDADKLFKNNDYSCLWKDLETKVTNYEVGDKKAIYVLIYRNQIRRVESKEFLLHIWDFTSVKKLRNWNFASYTSWLSSELNPDKTVERFCDKIWDYEP